MDVMEGLDRLERANNRRVERLWALGVAVGCSLLFWVVISAGSRELICWIWRGIMVRCGGEPSDGFEYFPLALLVMGFFHTLCVTLGDKLVFPWTRKRFRYAVPEK